MADDEIRIEQVEVTVDWSASDAMTSVYANQFLTQVTPEEVVMVFGQISPPALVGGLEVIKAYVEKHGSKLAVQPVAKVTFNPSKLDELVRVLTETAEKLKLATEVRAASAGSGEGDS
jgi:hypothetical protein